MCVRARRCVYMRVCARRRVLFWWCGCVYTSSLTMLADVRQCCRLLIFICLTPFETLSLLQNLVNKESDSDITHLNRQVPFCFVLNHKQVLGNATFLLHLRRSSSRIVPSRRHLSAGHRQCRPRWVLAPRPPACPLPPRGRGQAAVAGVCLPRWRGGSRSSARLALPERIEPSALQRLLHRHRRPARARLPVTSTGLVTR